MSSMDTQTNTPPFLIAIDGLSAAGKGTLGRKLADHYGFTFFDTGKLYRLVGFTCLSLDKDVNNEADVIDVAKEIVKNFDPKVLSHEILKSNEVGNAASCVARYQPMRDLLISLQRDTAFNAPSGAILDGRDIGTVILPDAHVKFFVTADPQKRADRRIKELQSLGIPCNQETILSDLIARDHRDTTSETGKTFQADDAILLDTSDLDIEQTFDKAREIIDQKYTV